MSSRTPVFTIWTLVGHSRLELSWSRTHKQTMARLDLLVTMAQRAEPSSVLHRHISHWQKNPKKAPILSAGSFAGREVVNAPPWKRLQLPDESQRSHLWSHSGCLMLTLPQSKAVAPRVARPRSGAVVILTAVDFDSSADPDEWVTGSEWSHLPPPALPMALRLHPGRIHSLLSALWRRCGASSSHGVWCYSCCRFLFSYYHSSQSSSSFSSSSSTLVNHFLPAALFFSRASSPPIFNHLFLAWFIA